MDQQPAVGRIVHYVLPDGTYPGAHRPAMIVRTWGSDEHPSETVQLAVFLDGSNDYPNAVEPGTSYLRPFWKTSIMHDEDEKKPNSWHWPERVQ